MKNKKRYSWTTLMHVEVDFDRIYYYYFTFFLERNGMTRDEAIKRAVRYYITKLNDAEYYSLTDEVREQIETDFKAWLAENGK